MLMESCYTKDLRDFSLDAHVFEHELVVTKCSSYYINTLGLPVAFCSHNSGLLWYWPIATRYFCGMEIVRNQKGGQKLLYDGYANTKKATRNERVQWECSNTRAFGCTTPFTTHADGETVIVRMFECFTY